MWSIATEVLLFQWSCLVVLRIDRDMIRVVRTSRQDQGELPLPSSLPRRPLGRWVVVGRPSEDEDVPLGMTNEVKEHASDADPVR